MKRYSILNNLDKCFFCVGLCHAHHNTTGTSVHFNKEMDLELKRVYQKEYEKNHTREEFIKLIGKSYLD